MRNQAALEIRKASFADNVFCYIDINRAVRGNSEVKVRGGNKNINKSRQGKENARQMPVQFHTGLIRFYDHRIMKKEITLAAFIVIYKA